MDEPWHHKDSDRQLPFDDPYFLSDLHLAVIDRLEDDHDLLSDDQYHIRRRVTEMVDEYLLARGLGASQDIRLRLTVDVLNEITGYGPLQDYLDRSDISDILINGPQQVYIELNGRLEVTSAKFINNSHVLRVVRRMLAPLGKRLDETSPIVDARLPDGSRVNAIIPPLALDGPCVSIRKFKADILTAEHLVNSGSVSDELMEILLTAVHQRRNILISGGTGSGKTTLLNVLSADIPAGERVVTIEDSAELRLNNAHVVRLETRVPNTENEGGVDARQLMRNALRMRPDRIILGESRGDEVLDMLQAMNTGHMGSMSTIHSNSAADALVRLQMMVRLSGFQGTDRLVNQIIATALDLIVHVVRDERGFRFVEEVVQVKGVQHGEVNLSRMYHHEHLEVVDELCWKKQLQEIA